MSSKAKTETLLHFTLNLVPKLAGREEESSLHGSSSDDVVSEPGVLVQNKRPESQSLDICSCILITWTFYYWCLEQVGYVASSHGISTPADIKQGNHIQTQSLPSSQHHSVSPLAPSGARPTPDVFPASWFPSMFAATEKQTQFCWIKGSIMSVHTCCCSCLCYLSS